jgi:hypothetical protein
MQPHLSNLQFLVGIAALALLGILILATTLDIRKRRKSPPFLNYFRTDFDQDQYDWDSSRQGSFSGLDEWRAYHRGHQHVYEARGTGSHHGVWG